MSYVKLRMSLENLQGLLDFAKELNVPWEYLTGIAKTGRDLYLSHLSHSKFNPYLLWLKEEPMTTNKSISWSDAEKSFPECTAAWDRDVGIANESIISDI